MASVTHFGELIREAVSDECLFVIPQERRRAKCCLRCDLGRLREGRWRVSGGIDGMLGFSSAPWIFPFLLLLMRERDPYGHELTRGIAALDSGMTHPEVVYRSLRQIKGEGLVLSGGNRLDRRLPLHKYSITELGEAHFEFWANSLARYQEDIDLFLRAYAERSAQEVR
jgi:DNA-binding PadR family transcriptional regulator